MNDGKRKMRLGRQAGRTPQRAIASGQRSVADHGRSVRASRQPTDRGEMTDISESQTSKTRTLTPLPWAPGEKIDFAACRSIKVICVSEIGWADNRDMMQDISSGGGLAASQWRIPWREDNARGSCSLLEVEGLDGARRRLLIDAGWNRDYMRERLATTGVAELILFGDPVVRSVRAGPDNNSLDPRRTRDQDRAVRDNENRQPVAGGDAIDLILHRTSVGVDKDTQLRSGRFHLGAVSDLFWRFKLAAYTILTSTYFEADPPFPEGDKRRHGYSRDHRPDCVQVVIALIDHADGLPWPMRCCRATPPTRRH